MAALNTTTFAYALKTLYSQRKMENLVYAKNPWLAMVPKDTNFVGANFVEPLIYGHTPAVGAGLFSTTQGRAAASKGAAFTLTRVKDYSFAQIDSETILASRGNSGAFMTAVKREMDSAIHAITRSLAKGLYGDGYGTLGIQSGAAGAGALTANQIQLATVDDVTNFEVGMYLTASAPTGIVPHGTLATALYIVAVDRDAGVLTLSATPTGFDTGDLLINANDIGAVDERNKMMGLAAWIPYTAETTGTFFAVDRTLDVSRLQGHRLDGTAMNIDEALMKGAVRVAREGGAPDTALLSYEKWEEFVNLLGNKVVYESHKVGEVGFQSLRVQGPAGPIDVFADQNCPSNRLYVLTKNMWKLRSLGPAPQILNLDGLQMSRMATTDSWEIRVGFFGNLSCSAPGYNAVVAL